MNKNAYEYAKKYYTFIVHINSDYKILQDSVLSSRLGLEIKSYLTIVFAFASLLILNVSPAPYEFYLL